MIGEPNAPDWLVRRPIAHRGLHDRAAGTIENSLAAARAAVAGGFAVECDVQLAADGEAVVFHDAALDRLTASTGPVAALRSADLCAIALAGSATDRIPTLTALLDAIDRRVPLICEVKSGFSGDMRLADRVAELATAYGGPLAIKSFDPAVIAHLRGLGTAIPLGIVAEASYDDPEWAALAPDMRAGLAALAHVADTRPDFLSWRVHDLPHAAPMLFRVALGRPVMSWTVRTPDQRQRAARWADQMVFEGFAP
ncbi:glycerophosphodiester phosphodiesterase family protein [Lichenibacterium minor]|uniref:glycerophosphodiester phosphodiesterase family protein n=1 Tax=Lichenibacterium minor TaxID=2316528 RepID=UPI0026B534CA